MHISTVITIYLNLYKTTASNVIQFGTSVLQRGILALVWQLPTPTPLAQRILT